MVFFEKKVVDCPTFLFKNIILKIEKADIMRWKTKDAVLEGYVECSDLVAFNFYFTKPVHFCLWRLRIWC